MHYSEINTANTNIKLPVSLIFVILFKDTRKLVIFFSVQTMNPCENQSRKYLASFEVVNLTSFVNTVHKQYLEGLFYQIIFSRGRHSMGACRMLSPIRWEYLNCYLSCSIS